MITPLIRSATTSAPSGHDAGEASAVRRVRGSRRSVTGASRPARRCRRRRPSPRPIRLGRRLRPPPVISRPISPTSASATGNDPTIRPSYMTSTRSARARISSRSSEISRIAAPAARRSSSSAVDGLDRADVEARASAGRRPSAAARVVDLAGEDQPLEVAAGQQPRLRVDRGRRDRVRRPSARSASAARRRVVDEPAARDRRVAVALHDQVVGERQVRGAADARPVLRARGRPRGGSPSPADRLAIASPSTVDLPACTAGAR